MKKTILYILAFCSPVLTFSQSNVIFHDISSDLEQSKIFTISHDELSENNTKKKINIDYIYKSLEQKLNGDNNLNFKFTSSIDKIKSISKSKITKRLSKTKSDIVQNIILGDTIIANLDIIGRKYIQKDHVCILFTIDLPKFSGVIYEASSLDGEKTWLPPHVAIKHNNIELTAWDIAYSQQRKKFGIFVIMTDEDHSLYTSKSIDNGTTWTYPEKTYKSVVGTEFHSSSYNNKMAIIYKSKHNYLQSKIDDIAIWCGSIKNIYKNKFEGKLLKIANKSSKINWGIKMISSNTLFIINTEVVNSKILINGYILKFKNIR